MFLNKIKIWFQNRRTKFKRKYTSDVETLASHYYSSLGIGGLARPMVVGDRLWLFSQPPHGPPAPIQSLLLNNVPPAPQHISSLHPSVMSRTYGPQATPSMIVRQGYNMNTPNTISGPAGFMNKQMRFDYFNKLQFSLHDRVPSEVADFRFGNKTLLKSSENLDEQNVSNLASLESRFGNNSSILSDKNKFQEAVKVNESLSSSSGSEIDCEEMEN